MNAIDKAFESRDRKFRKGRLGDSRMTVKNPEADVFAATFFMANEVEMDAIIDTATELIALQGAECEECTGTKYDI